LNPRPARSHSAACDCVRNDIDATPEAEGFGTWMATAGLVAVPLAPTSCAISESRQIAKPTNSRQSSMP
jgi:hypothetical protein